MRIPWMPRGVKSVASFSLRKFATKVIAHPIRSQLAAFEAATYQPQEVQEASCAYPRPPRRHGFRPGPSLQRYSHRHRLSPEPGYRRLRILRALHRPRPPGRHECLARRQTVHMFALTSGTTAARKFIPVTDQYLADYRRGWNIWGLKVYRCHPEVRMRPIVQLSGDW